MKGKFFLVLALVCLLFVFAVPAFAQDTAPDPTLQPELEAALAAILELVTSLTFSPLTAAFVLVLTALLKKLLPESIGAGVIALVLQVLAWVALTAARHFGVEAQFLTALEAITVILGALIGLVGSSYLATRFYNGAKTENVPLLGDSRS